MMIKNGKSWKHKATALLLSAVFMFSQMCLLPNSQLAFAADAQTERYIKKLTEQGILFGDQYGNVDAERTITRAEFVAMVNRAFGLSETSAVKFSDIKGDEWYANDINVAKTAGYFSGAEKNKALPNSSLTREQATALVYRNLHYDKPAPENYTYTDSMSFSTWGRPAINTATQKGFIEGYSDGSFRPAQPITRGEVFKMLSVAVGDQISEAGEKSLGNTTGNVTIAASGVTLRNTIINGDLYITEGVGLGFTTFDNVTVTGQVIVSGAGASNAGDSSILFNDCNMGTLLVDGPTDKTVALRMDGNTNIQDTKIKSNTIMEEYSNHASGFHNVTLQGAEDTTLRLRGDYDKVTVMQPKNYLYLDSGSIAELVVDEEAPDSTVNLYEDTYTDKLYLDIPTKVTGTGDVGYLKVNAPDCNVAMLPDIIDITPGLTATINGKLMTSKDGIQASSQPKILSKYPVMEEVAPTTAKAIYKTNKQGVLHYAVTLADEDKLTEEEILKPTTVKTILKSGTANMKAETELTQNIGGLKVNTEYRLNAVLVDEREDVSSINRETFTTADNITPAYVSGYPKIVSTTNTSALANVVSTKDVTVHWAVLLKNHKAPTEIELKKNKAEGAVAKGSTKAKKNEIAAFTASGLEELKDYDVYIMMTDGENDSKVSKLSFITKDMTPPEFITGYPKMDKITEKSIIVKSMINEAGTVYYALMKRGAAFPPPVEGQPTPPLTSDEAKMAIVTGNNTLKNGKTAAKEKVELSTTISGLEPETTYDLYMVAEDKAKNLSDIKTLVVKTSDTIPPKATQEFEDIVEDKPEAMTDIRIVFSEEVWNSLTNQPITQETLQDCIALYDMSAPKRVPVLLDYYQCAIELVDGKTIVTFPAAARPENLRSGNKYEFELNNIIDTSGNKMQQKTKLPVFQIVAPLVELIKTTPTNDNMDMTFQIYPTSVDTADEMLFDAIMTFDHPVHFELYEKNIATGEFEPVTDIDGNTKDNVILVENTSISLYSILDQTVYEDGTVTKKIPYAQFNILEDKEYGVRVTQVEASKRGEWSGVVKLNVKCLIGSRSTLDIAPRDYKAALNNGGVEVHTPKDFELSYTFLDTLLPEFVSPYPNIGEIDTDNGQPSEFEQYPYYSLVGDNMLRVKVAANKVCTAYYMVAPEGSTGLGGRPITAEDLINLTSKPPDNGVKGTFEIESANMEKSVDILGITPNMNYDFYIVIRSDSYVSKVYKLQFRTKDVYAPTITNVRPSKVGDGSVDVTFTVDRTCKVDWIAYRSESSEGPAMAEVTADVIRAKKETPSGYKPLDSGTASINVPLASKEATFTVTVKNLERGLYYTFYAVAKSPLGGNDSNIAILENFTPADLTPPSIELKTAIENPGIDNKGKPYIGSLLVKFSEPIYYYTGEMDEETGTGKIAPVTLAIFSKSLKISNPDNIYLDGSSSALKARIAITDYQTAGGSSSMYRAVGDNTGLESVIFQFRNIAGSAFISSDLVICDSSGNKMGKFTLTFVDNDKKGDGTLRKDSKWEVSINKT